MCKRSSVLPVLVAVILCFASCSASKEATVAAGSEEAKSEQATTEQPATTVGGTRVPGNKVGIKKNINSSASKSSNTVK